MPKRFLLQGEAFAKIVVLRAINIRQTAELAEPYRENRDRKPMRGKPFKRFRNNRQLSASTNPKTKISQTVLKPMQSAKKLDTERTRTSTFVKEASAHRV